jgi:transposase
VEARFTSSTVEIIYKGKRITSHRRSYNRGRHTTKSEHMPRSHRAHAEWTPSRLIRWASKTGPATGRLVAEVLRRRPHPEQGYRACLGIMRLGRRYGAERLEAASRRAEHLRSYSYRTLKNILSSAQDRLPFDGQDARSTPPTPVHANIRGADYYAAQEEEIC